METNLAVMATTTLVGEAARAWGLPGSRMVRWLVGSEEEGLWTWRVQSHDAEMRREDCGL